MTAETDPKHNPHDIATNPGSESPGQGPRDRDRHAEPPPDSPEEMAQGAHGRYGIEEESIESPSLTDASRIRKDPDEISRDAARDAEVRNTGEDVGG
jgi:hypothetical protein